MYVPRLRRELWIASDPFEAARLRQEMIAAGDARPILLAHDVMRLEEQPRELIDAVVLTLAVTGGKLASVGPVRRETAPAGTPKPLGADNAPNWSGDARKLVGWFAIALASGLLPTEPFHLSPHTQIVDPARWYGSLELDVAAGPRGPRASSLVLELQQLRQIVALNHERNRSVAGRNVDSNERAAGDLHRPNTGQTAQMEEV